ncbi:hypothetical protein CF335_g9623, partial [Tilletia laevis]
LSQLKTRHVGASLKLPNRSTTPMAKEPAPSPQPLAQSTSTAEAPAGPSLLALSALRKADASRLEVPTVAALRLALSSRFAALTPRTDVEQALEVLETSCGCGNEPRAAADKMFDVWLSGIQDLAPDHTDDEDELGQGFGHREIGRFDYRTTLKRINAWGSIKNALRLLSALLRIWAIGMSQLSKDTTSEVQPLVHNHIKQVAELIKSAFALGNEAPTGSSSTPSTSNNQQASASNSQQAEADAAPKRQIRVKKNLNKGIVTADALKKLTKKAACELLSQGDIHFSSRANKQDVINILLKAFENNKITITTAQFYAAMNKVDADDN